MNSNEEEKKENLPQIDQSGDATNTEDDDTPAERHAREEQERSTLSPRMVTAMLIIVAILVSVVSTFFLTSLYYTNYLYGNPGRNANTQETGLYTSVEDSLKDLDEFAALMYMVDRYSFYAYDLDKEALLTAAMKSYVAATGDLYASYYTADEYEAYVTSNTGNVVGVGIVIVREEVEYNDETHTGLRILSFLEGNKISDLLQINDYIIAVKDTGGNWIELPAKTDKDFNSTYTSMVGAIKGELGTEAHLRIMRGTEIFEITAERVQAISRSVNYHICTTDETTGIVQLTNFDMTTPPQLKEAMTKLTENGVTNFIFDLRDNPGGDLLSIKAVLTYFLKSGDLIISTVDRDDKAVRTYLAEAQTYSGVYAPCSVAESEIGMYRDKGYQFAVLVNENTASAAEVFTSVMRDYELATIIGTKTFGKGIMQTYYSMERYGFDGVVKLTSNQYLPPCGISYHNIGIKPSEGFDIELDEAASNINVLIREDAVDNQIQAAVELFKSQNN